MRNLTVEWFGSQPYRKGLGTKLAVEYNVAASVSELSLASFPCLGTRLNFPLLHAGREG